jgi:hypothetical protein
MKTPAENAQILLKFQCYLGYLKGVLEGFGGSYQQMRTGDRIPHPPPKNLKNIGSRTSFNMQYWLDITKIICIMTSKVRRMYYGSD